MTEYDSSGFQIQPERYAKIDESNRHSFLFHELDSLQVIQSLHSAGPSREQALGRVTLAGNMSPLNGYGPRDLSAEQKISDAKQNIETFLRQHDVDPWRVRILRPERDYTTPLTTIYLDEADMQPDDAGLLRPDMAGDCIYSFSPDVVLAARPADCPVVFISAETPKGEMTALLHLAWMGVSHGYVSQAKQVFDELEVDWKTLRANITSGGHGESYKFTHYAKGNPHETYPGYEGLFIDVEEVKTEDGSLEYNFAIDVAAEVYEEIVIEWDIDPYQVFLDTSDTTSPETGYSSHSRSFRNYPLHGENSRDIVLAMRRK